MNKRVPVVLLVLAALFLAAAFFLSRGSATVDAADAGPHVATPKVTFPRGRPYKKKSSAPLSQLPPERVEQQKKALDQLQRALVPKDSHGAVFVEVNALRHTPLMEKLLKCREGEMLEGMNAMKNELGIDPLEDLDRVGVMEDVVAASGFFSELKVPKELGEGTAYGDSGRIYRAEQEGQAVYLGRVGDELLLTADSEDKLKAAMDRASGTGEVGESYNPNMANSAVYGGLDGKLLAALLQGSGNPQAQRLADIVGDSNMRMDVDDNIAASFDVSGKTPEQGDQLRKAMTAALAIGRARAQQEGDTQLADLLEQARVAPNKDGSFQLDLAVPGDTLLTAMGCDKDGNPQRDAPTPTAPAPTTP